MCLCIPPLSCLAAAAAPATCRLSCALSAGHALCRWMGHGTMWILTAHAALYYVYWATSKAAGGCVEGGG